MYKNKKSLITKLLVNALPFILVLLVSVFIGLTQGSKVYALTQDPRAGYGFDQHTTANVTDGRQIDVDFPNYATIGASWYFDWGWQGGAKPGLEYMPLAGGYRKYTVSELQPTSYACTSIKDYVDANPSKYPNGTRWFIGNEVGANWDDKRTPEGYALEFPLWKQCIKGINSTFEVGSSAPYTPFYIPATGGCFGGSYPYTKDQLLVGKDNPSTRSGLGYMDKFFEVLSASQSAYTFDVMPDFVTVHGYTSDCTSKTGLTSFYNLVDVYRQLMKDHGLQDKDMIITEWDLQNEAGIYGYSTFDITNYMDYTVRMMESYVDNTYGKPGDDYKMVQKWAWFVFDSWKNNTNFTWWKTVELFNTDTAQITTVGQKYKDIIADSMAPLCTGSSVQKTLMYTNGSTNVITVTGVKSDVTSVVVKAWTTAQGQDDLTSYNATNQGGGTWTATLSISNHVKPGDTYPGTVNIQVYASNPRNPSGLMCNNTSTFTINLPVCTSASFQSAVTTAQTSNVVTVSGVRSDVTQVKVPTWSSSQGQDDIVWYNAVNQGSGVWKATINSQTHMPSGNTYPDTMNAHIYGYSSETPSGFNCAVTSTSITNPNLALNKGVSTSTGSYGWQNAAMVDGNTGTYWTIANVPQWAQVDLGAAYTVNHVRLRTGPNMAGGAQISIRNGASPELKFTGNISLNSNSWYDYTFTPASVQNVRIYNPVGSNPGLTVQWSEIEVYAR